MNKSESIKNLAIALSKFQGEIKNPPKSADNPFFKSKYTTLDALIDTAKPLLEKNGLSYIQCPGGDGSNITITTLLMHDSGEWIESEPLTLKADKPTAQGGGSAITYARRYSLAAVLGIASDEDDDGNGANNQSTQPHKGKNNENPSSNKGNKPSTNLCTKEQISELFKLAENRKKDIAEFDFLAFLADLAVAGSITTKYPYLNKEKSKINWTLTDYTTIKDSLELPF